MDDGVEKKQGKNNCTSLNYLENNEWTNKIITNEKNYNASVEIVWEKKDGSI